VPAAELVSEQNPIAIRGVPERGSLRDPIVIMDSERQAVTGTGSGTADDPVVIE